MSENDTLRYEKTSDQNFADAAQQAIDLSRTQNKTVSFSVNGSTIPVNSQSTPDSLAEAYFQEIDKKMEDIYKRIKVEEDLQKSQPAESAQNAVLKKYREKNDSAESLTHETQNMHTFEQAAEHALEQSKLKQAIVSFTFNGDNITMTPESTVDEAYQAFVMDKPAGRVRYWDQKAEKLNQELNGGSNQTMATDNSNTTFQQKLRTKASGLGSETNAAQAVAQAVKERDQITQRKQAEEQVAAENIARQQRKKAEAEQEAAQQKPAQTDPAADENAETAGLGLAAGTTADSKFTNVPAKKAENPEEDAEFMTKDLSGEHRSLFTFLAGHSGGSMKPANVEDALGAEFMDKLQEERGVTFNENGTVELNYKTGEKLLLSAQQNRETGATELVVTLPKGTAMTEEIAQDMVRIQKARGASVVSIGKKNASFEQRAMLLQAAKNEGMNVSRQSFKEKEWQKLSVNNPETPEVLTLLQDMNETQQNSAQILNDGNQPEALRHEAQQNIVRNQALHSLLVDTKASPAGFKADSKTVFAVQKILADGKKADGGVKPATLDKALTTAGMAPADIQKLDQAATPAAAPKTAPKTAGGTIPQSTFQYDGTATKTQGAPLQPAAAQKQQARRSKAPTR